MPSAKLSTMPTVSNTTSLKVLSRALAVACAAVWLAGCETTGSSGPQARAEPPMTHARAASECWMRTEKDAAQMNLDRRADIVTKCIDDKMKADQAVAAPAAREVAARPEAKQAAKPPESNPSDARR